MPFSGENSKMFWRLAHSTNLTPLIHQISKWHNSYECTPTAKILATSMLVALP